MHASIFSTFIEVSYLITCHFDILKALETSHHSTLELRFIGSDRREEALRESQGDSKPQG
jgi:hypothetical protein